MVITKTMTQFLQGFNGAATCIGNVYGVHPKSLVASHLEPGWWQGHATLMTGCDTESDGTYSSDSDTLASV